MFGDEKKLKDISSPSTLQGEGRGEVSLSLSGISVSYSKTQKLITALYMVTDIIDKDEPLRNKLRTLGVEILSDTHLIQQNNTGNTMSFMCNKISELMSFLGIASDINIISEMNCNILRKEFAELNQSIKESINNNETQNKQINLSEFFGSFPEESDPYQTSTEIRGRSKEGIFTQSFNQENSKGHHNSNSIGVQKGSTLLKALSRVGMPARPIGGSNIKSIHLTADVFDALKKQRQESIINIIKTISGGATIKDIKDRVRANPAQAGSLSSTSEKTLQRELVSMVKNGVLERTGEKRWSKYFLK